jgi:hypothetical protein
VFLWEGNEYSKSLHAISFGLVGASGTEVAEDFRRKVHNVREAL